jgi:hypothetical protein
MSNALIGNDSAYYSNHHPCLSSLTSTVVRSCSKYYYTVILLINVLDKPQPKEVFSVLLIDLANLSESF